MFLKTRVSAIKGLYNQIRTFYRYQKYKSIIVDRYGKGSWVVITGGSQGIGREYAIQLSTLGFNIFIISNDEEAHKEILQLQLNPNSKIETKVFDFRYYKDDTKCQELYEKLKNLDISIVINNVGMMRNGLLEDIDYQDIQDMMVVNSFSTFWVTKYLLGKLRERKRPAAILNMGSYSSESYFPNTSIYAGTKAAVSHFS